MPRQAFIFDGRHCLLASAYLHMRDKTTGLQMGRNNIDDLGQAVEF
jgi:hypothetical protein